VTLTGRLIRLVEPLVRIGDLNNDIPGSYHPGLAVVRLEDKLAMGEDDVVCAVQRDVAYYHHGLWSDRRMER
jgi:hypothetical protein